MRFTIPYAQGLDWQVERANERLYPYLKSLWGMTDANYNSFGRAVRNKVSDGYIPEYFNAATNGYVSSNGKNTSGGLFFEDGLAAVSFWGLVDPIKKAANRDDIARMQLIFFVDTTKIYPGQITNSQGQRLDDICVNDVRNFLQYNGCAFTPTDVYKDIDKVLERYSGTIKRNVLNKNMNRFLAFRIDGEIHYNAVLHNSPDPLPQQLPMDRSIVLFIKDSPDPTKTIPIGNGKFLYQEYAPGNKLIPTLVDSAAPYLKGKNMQLLVYNNQADTMAAYSQNEGAWDRTGLGTPYGFLDGDFILMLFTDLI